VLVFRAEAPLLREAGRKLSIEGLTDVLGHHWQKLESTAQYVSIWTRTCEIPYSLSTATSCHKQVLVIWVVVHNEVAAIPLSVSPLKCLDPFSYGLAWVYQCTSTLTFCRIADRPARAEFREGHASNDPLRQAVRSLGER
jgi:hypothetical protein